MTPKTKTIRAAAVLVVQRIPDPDLYEQILRHKWKVLHLPTNGICGTFRYQKTARIAAKWLSANISAEILAANNEAAIVHAGEKAGWLEKREELTRNEF